MVSKQLLDIAFIPFSLAELEKRETIGDGGYAKMIIYAFYTHSLVGALLLSILAASLASILWKKSKHYYWHSCI